MASRHISKRSVDAAKPGGADVYVWDDELAGFGLKVTPAGRKVYLVQYRVGGRKGRTRRVTIGPHGAITPDKAWGEAKRLLGQVASGHDPADARDHARADQTLGAVLDQFMAEHVVTKLKASTAEEYDRLARLYVGRDLRNRRIGEVKRAEIARFHHDLRKKPYQANRTLALLSKLRLVSCRLTAPIIMPFGKLRPITNCRH